VIAQEAIRRETGARGLRAILENLMLDIMYEIPSSTKLVKECIITADAILKNEPPILVYEDEREALTA
jgi:ATP-dependent Clp protease ATP-binding subunit ClpX